MRLLTFNVHYRTEHLLVFPVNLICFYLHFCFTFDDVDPEEFLSNVTGRYVTFVAVKITESQ